MRAIVLRKPGAPENLSIEEVEDPTPAADEVVVRLRAAALNHRDVWIRSGTGAYSAGFERRVILGSDGAGEIVAAGVGGGGGVRGARSRRRRATGGPGRRDQPEPRLG
jgi:zinc-binding alcohol dehydrogenase/oxidoreductase